MRGSHLLKVAASCAVLFLSMPALANTPAPQTGLVYETVARWQLPNKPLDLVQTVDGKYIFILTDQNTVLIYEANGQLKGSVPVPEGVSAIDADARGDYLLLTNEKDNSFSIMSVDFVVDITAGESPVKGNPDAPVTITVFTDFECPYCKQLVPMLDQVFQRNQANVKIIFKNMPLRFHEFAEPAARAALAARNQGKFWEMHDILFAAPELSSEVIATAASGLGLDMNRFNQDMNSQAVSQQLAKDIKAAQEAGVTGTPTVFINGRRLKNRSLEGFQQLIDQQLKK